MSRKEELLRNLKKITEKPPERPKHIVISNQYGEDKDGNPIYIDRMYGGLNSRYNLIQKDFTEYKGTIKTKRVHRKTESGEGYYQQFHVTNDGRWFDNSGMPCDEPKNVKFKEEEKDNEEENKQNELDMLKDLKWQIK